MKNLTALSRVNSSAKSFACMFFAGLLLAQGIQAALIFVDDSNPSVPITIDWSGIYRIAIGPYDSANPNPGQPTVPDGSFQLFGGPAAERGSGWQVSAYFSGNAGTGSRDIYFVDSPSSTHPSDILSYSYGDAGGGYSFFQWQFVSDYDGNLAGISLFGVDPANIFVETGSPYVVTLDGLTASFLSDTGVVPEPTTMITGALLLLLPFGATTLRMLRKRCAA